MKLLPQFDLTGQVALVTGAARGLGRAISLELAQAGADVALGLRDVSTGGELASEIVGVGPPGFAAANGRDPPGSNRRRHRRGGRALWAA